MEIKEFVKEAISDISDAVSELNNEKRDGGLVVNPCKYSLNGINRPKINDERMIYEVEFNLSVTVSDKNEVGGKLGIKIAGVGGNSESASSNTCNIKFLIPVVYPRPER